MNHNLRHFCAKTQVLIAEVLLVLAGHESSLYPKDHHLHPAFAPLLHPGEQECLEALGLIALRYRNIKSKSSQLSQSSSRYVCALCATLTQILQDEYDTLVVRTEEKVLKRDASLVASGSFVPLSSIRATFADWDAPLAALQDLMVELENKTEWLPGPLIDVLMSRSHTGMNKIADVFSRLSCAVQRVWRTQLTALIVHGSINQSDPLVSEDYIPLEGSMPSCVSAQTRDSILYIGRAIGTVKAEKWQAQLPRALAQQHTEMIHNTLPEDTIAFDRVVSAIRTNVSEWLWLHVLTQADVDDAAESLANYFLLRNGEFGLALIQEIERLKLSRLTVRSGQTSMIREQDLNLALLRASLGTSAQHDAALTKLRFTLPSGPLRPLLPSLGSLPANISSTMNPLVADPSLFSSSLLGTPLVLKYNISWPLDLFLQSSDLSSYAILFSYLSSLRRTQTQIHGCWSSLSNAQRARRRWTGHGEGGTSEDLVARKDLLRCGWGIVRDMGWFLDTLSGYMMIDVVDVEYRRFRKLLSSPQEMPDSVPPSFQSVPSLASATSFKSLDFSTLRAIHANYLDRLLAGCLLTNSVVTPILKTIFDTCERLAAQVERWGGDVLPALLFEGNLRGDGAGVGEMAQERRVAVLEINQTFQELLDSFYEHLSLSASPQQATAEATKSGIYNTSMANFTTVHMTSKVNGNFEDRAGDIRRHIERLTLRLDFNGRFSQRQWLKSHGPPEDILIQGGL